MNGELEMQIEAYIENYFTPEVHAALVRASWNNPHLEARLNQNAIHIFTGLLAPISYFLFSIGFLPSATKLRQGNVLTSVCQSFCSQRGGVWNPTGMLSCCLIK